MSSVPGGISVLGTNTILQQIVCWGFCYSLEELSTPPWPRLGPAKVLGLSKRSGFARFRAAVQAES
jgi:hypothetical protein